MFQMVAHPELNKLGQVAIRDFLKLRARYLLLVKEKNKADDVNITPTTVVASLDSDLLENLAAKGKIKDAKSAEECTDENVLAYLKSTQTKDSTMTVDDRKNEVRNKAVFHMAENDPALRVTKEIGEYLTLYRNLKLDLVKNKPKRAVEHIVSVIKPTTLKSIVESDLELDKSDLKKDFFKFIEYFEAIAIVHDRHGRPDTTKNGGGNAAYENGSMNSSRSSGRGKSSGGNGNKHKKLDNSDTSKVSDNGGKANRSTEHQAPTCLNVKKCPGKRHYVSDCPNTKEAEAAELLAA
jgi:hypothetical protein